MTIYETNMLKSVLSVYYDYIILYKIRYQIIYTCYLYILLSSLNDLRKSRFTNDN